MSDIAIKVSDLSKLYKIGKKNNASIFDAARGLFRREKGDESDFWALNNLSFEIRKGDAVAIIGKNGAGKSTLLKVLSRITVPTKGRIEINGRVSSLLEVGTGFHPELTGRENIFLNGTILGMSRREIKAKFDEIVAFSGVEKFLDTPVKHYSSGMYVRLAFAVAAHLEPEILIIDEVLAVGDVEFQKKCIGKMKDVTGNGRTVLFVSHNFSAIENLCNKGILLKNGNKVFEGDVEKVIQMYSRQTEDEITQTPLIGRKDRPGNKGNFFIEEIDFYHEGINDPVSRLISGKNITVKFSYLNNYKEDSDNISFAIGFFTLKDSFLFSCRSDVVGSRINIASGRGEVFCEIPKFPLSSGKYYFNVIAYKNNETIDWVQKAGFIEVDAGDFFGTGRLPAIEYNGVFVMNKWTNTRKSYEFNQVS
jgi:lipopolysaccharide transport system ATP-binding protein